MLKFCGVAGLGAVLGASAAGAQITVLRDVTVIDGEGGAPRHHAALVIDGGSIRAVTDTGAAVPKGATVLDMAGKTVMPEIINAHGHVGLLKGTKTASANYSKENEQRELMQYQDYGVGAVLVMGTDHDEAYGWRAESHAGTLPGALLYTAGKGFGAPQGMPPLAMGMDQVYRPATAEEARADVRELAKHKPDVVKMWVDDFYGQFTKMKPEVYTAIIDEAHKQHLRVASHLFHEEDAQQLVDAGLDIMAHSVRDQEIPDSLIAEMKQKHVTYIGTLSLDDFAVAYAGDPAWLNEPFFRDALEPGVFAMITDPKYKETQNASKATAAERAALPIALKNLKKVYDAGIPVALGTDSGATPIRPFGFAEHTELQLLVQAGLTPLQAITVGTKNGATLLRASSEFGMLKPGLKANFVVLDKDPSEDIRNTELIAAVWKDGKKMSDGPHAP
ncbi:amidohydrolase family protein [Granulicella arctica]|uniref:amidohydrolase family protein n=1 Tax=Granulicella arctica TaxID=940613 RepID=UPI0021E0E46D|nr:amidohydrolase family protein [Granulicella arctica]